MEWLTPQPPNATFVSSPIAESSAGGNSFIVPFA